MQPRIWSLQLASIGPFFLMLLAMQANSQTPVYKNYTVNDGLPSQVVYCALQDKQGYMWFGTDAGVSRFDGKSFQNFTSNNGLSDNEVLKVFQDSKHRIWFLMLNGTLSYYKTGQIHSSSNDTLLRGIKAKRELMSFFEDNLGNIWIGSAGGELVVIPSNGKSRTLNLQNLEIYIASRLVYVFQDQGNLMVVVGSSLFLMENEKFSLVDSICYVSRNSPFVVAELLDKQSVAVSYKDGIRKIQNNQSTLILSKRDIYEYESMQRMFIDRNMGIWLITSDLKTKLYTKTTVGYYLHDSYLPGIYVGAVYVDREENIWFCTVGNGLNKLSMEYSKIKIFRGNTASKDQEIWSVNLDKENRIWFGTGYRMLYCANSDSIILELDIGSAQNRLGRVTRIDFDDNGSVWCSASTGVVKITVNSERNVKIEDVKTLSGLKNFNAKYIRFDSSNQAYFSSFRGVQKIFSRDGQNVYTSFVPLALDTPSRVYCLYFDKGNRLWYEKFNQLLSFDGQTVVRYNTLVPIFKSQISSIEGYFDSTLIISTYGNGIHFFKNGKIVNHVSEKDGLAGDLCRKIFVDSNTVYVATNQGFSFFNYDENVITDIRTVTMSDGIISNDIKDICARGDNIYLATSGGLCVVKKNIVQTTAVPPPLYITSVNSRGENFQDFTNLSFPYSADFNLSYIAITFDQPDKIIYQYNVTGNERDWIETKNSSITFSSLSPGAYSLQLRARKFNSKWSSISTLDFTIVPPVWQQWWFRGLVFLCLAAVTYFILQTIAERRYTAQLVDLREKQVLADERSRIAADMHDDLGADLSNLLLMSRMSGTDDPEPAKQEITARRFESYVNELILKVDEIIWALNPGNDTIKGTIEYMRDYVTKMTHLTSVYANVNMPKDLPMISVSAKFRRNLFLVLKESLNNIYRHSDATKLTLAFELADNNLHIELQDNGKGFDVRSRQAGADGLMNMQKRIEELGGNIFIKSQLGLGSAIKIIVPYC